MTTSGINAFSFPLNVYAHVLEKETGRVDYLHYGLFERPDTPVGEAQAQATELLWRHLPPPCRLLEVGIGLGTTLARLRAQGYQASGITPDAAQIAYARSRHGEQLPIACARLEDYAEGSGQWDALLFQESAQYVNPVDLFESAGRLLGENGRIIIMDEFALQRAGNLHYLEYFLRLAERAGFALETRIDLSALAQPTLDWLLAAVQKHESTLRAELGVSLDTLAALETSNRTYLQKYAQQEFGYFLLSFQRVRHPRWKLGRILPERADEMRALFAEVFGHAMSEHHWQWKYGEGRGAGIGVWRASDGQLVAQYGGISRPVLFFGQPTLACQPGDVMVSPHERGVLSRKGPFFLAASTFMERELGDGASHLLAFGFPNDRAFRLPQRLGLYAECGTVQELIWPTETAKTNAWLWNIDEISLRTPKEKALADACWNGMAAGLKDSIVGVRDAAYLIHRYVEHPGKRYRIFAARHCFGLRPSGLFVLRVDDAGRCELLDIIAPLAVIPQLRRLALQSARDLHCDALFLWATKNIAPAFGEGATVKDLPVVVPCNVWTPAPAPASLAGKWWLTGGDTDFH